MTKTTIPAQFTLYNHEDLQSFIVLLSKADSPSFYPPDMSFALRMTAKQLVENYFTQQAASGRDLEDIAQDSIIADIYSLCQQKSITHHYGMLSQHTSTELSMLEPFPSFQALTASTTNIDSWYNLSFQFAYSLSRLKHYPGVDTRELIYSGKWRAIELIQDLELLPASRYFTDSCRHILSSSLYTRIPTDANQHISRIVTISRLYPGSTIHPHYGISQNRFRIQIPVHIPATDCRIFCLDRWETWHPHNPLVLNDNYIHAVYNASSEIRTVVLVDIYHPMLFL